MVGQNVNGNNGPQEAGGCVDSIGKVYSKVFGW
jgi:hypothetical protein